MAMSRGPSKLGRIIALVLMGLTVFFTLMGGAGTTCVALGAEKYDSMIGLVPYKPLYQVLVVVSLAVGIWGIPVMVSLVRGGAKAYRNTLIILIIGALTSGIQTYVSQTVRGSSAPVNMRFAVTLFTLIVFLIFRISSIWRRMQFDQPIGDKSSKTAGRAALTILGILTLTSPAWVAQTHMEPWISGVRTPLAAIGVTMTLAGAIFLAVGDELAGTAQTLSSHDTSIAVQ